MTDGAVLDWLLEPDDANPGVRFFALQRLLDKPSDDPEGRDARAHVMRTGPVPAILASQEADGHWVKPGPGYSPKYRGTVWQLIALAAFGADPEHLQVQRACEYVLCHTQTTGGGFGCSGALTDHPPPSSALHCLNGNLLDALIRLGWLHDERVQRALEWQALAITGEEPSFAYYKSMTSGPGFQCGVNAGQPCAWGANKALRGLLAIPEEERSASVHRALDLGAEFLLSRDPAVADYPYTERVSNTWFRLGLLLSYWSDVLETLEVLTALGYGRDQRLDEAFNWVLAKRDAEGRWKLENTINGKTWADVEQKGQPSKWVTLRALSVLKAAARDG